MASITYTKSAQCTGGQHVTLTRSGDFSGSRLIHLSEVLNKPLNNEELLQMEILALRLHCDGKTAGQLNTEFTNGVAMTI